MFWKGYMPHIFCMKMVSLIGDEKSLHIADYFTVIFYVSQFPEVFNHHCSKEHSDLTMSFFQVLTLYNVPLSLFHPSPLLFFQPCLSFAGFPLISNFVAITSSFHKFILQNRGQWRFVWRILYHLHFYRLQWCGQLWCLLFAYPFLTVLFVSVSWLLHLYIFLRKDREKIIFSFHIFTL